jgi:hypothetical protein
VPVEAEAEVEVGKEEECPALVGGEGDAPKEE